eukprot:Phypoly_transcript_09583.p1 GENE.Phypoly_transcript_09583~~Phypoly_transcript_09583.p1  ORF type:complete len:370 (+),score=39.22 Phypoly_transcript_09583:218-1327(+)
MMARLNRVWGSKFAITTISVVVLSNIVFAMLSYKYSSSPYSYFTRNVHTEGSGNYRQDDIKSLLGEYKQQNVKTNPHLWLCVGITTMNRAPKPSYLLKTVHSLFATLDESERNQMYVVVNNADKNPDAYEEANLLSSYVEVVQHTETGLKYYAKQVKDYANTLQECSEKANYTLILEDDVAATRHWVDKLSKYIPELNKRSNYLYVKLFETRAYVGWEDTDTGFLILVGILSTFLAFFILRSILREERFCWAKSITLGIYVGSAVIFFMVAIGKQNVFPPTPGIHSIRTCCSQAHLYPQKMAKILADYLFSKGKEPHDWADLVMNYWAEEQHYDTLVIYPSLFQHMGAISSVISNDRSYIISYTYREDR